MTDQVLIWVMAIPLLGFISGMRTLTPIAVLCWFAWMKMLPLDGSWAWWCATIWAVLGFTLLAGAEYAVDKLGIDTSTTRIPVLLVRFFMGGLVGAIVASSLNASGLEAVLLAVPAAMMGAFADFQLRRQLSRRLGCSPWHVTLAEDLLAVACAVIAMGIVTA